MACVRLLPHDHPTAKLVSKLIHQLLVIDARLPFLLAVKAEGERMVDMRDGSDEEFNECLAEGCNKHLDALFPDGEPALDSQHIDEMVERFKADTQPTERDRNDARAHRFGKRAKNAQAAFQTLDGFGHVPVGLGEHGA